MTTQTTQRYNYYPLAPKTTCERDAIDATEGTLIYNTTDGELQVFTNTGWRAIAYSQPLRAVAK